MDELSTRPKENGGNTFHLEESSPLRETTSDPFRKPRWLRNASELSIIVGSMITFSVVVTIALIVQIVVGAPQITPHAVVISEDEVCSQVGLNFLKDHDRMSPDKGKSITVDAAIVTALCLSIKNPHLGGIGGGGFMMIQQQHLTNDDTASIDFREMSPTATNTTITGPKGSVEKVNMVAVPGFIKGMAKAHSLYGSLTWDELFDPIIQLANSGVEVNDDFAKAIENLDITTASESVKELVLQDDKTKKKKGDIVIQTKLALTLKEISKGTDAFYRSKVATDLLQDIPGSKMRLEDLHSYEAKVAYDILEVKFPDAVILGPKPPASSFATLCTLNTMKSYGIDISTEDDKKLQTHRMLEATKYAYADLATMGDTEPNAAKFLSTNRSDEIKAAISDTSTKANLADYLNGINLLDLNTGGEQHLSIIGSDGFVVTIAMGIGSVFGSQIMTGGFFLNNAMLDFSWKGKSENYLTDLDIPPENQLAAKKRPMSIMAPILVIPQESKCGRYFAFDNDFGNGSIQSSGIAEVLMKNLTQHMDIEKSINSPRTTQAFNPYAVAVENEVDQSLVTYLTDKNHVAQKLEKGDKIGKCSAIEYYNSKMSIYDDPRDLNNTGVQF